MLLEIIMKHYSTNYFITHAYTSSNYIYFSPLQYVDLTHYRLKKVPVPVSSLTKVEVSTLATLSVCVLFISFLLQHLCLRQNLIIDISPISELTTLTELDLYDNEIKDIHGLEKLISLGYDTIINYNSLIIIIISLVIIRL